MTSKTTKQRKNFFHKLQQPNKRERLQYKRKLYSFTNQTDCAKHFDTSVSNVYEAFKGNNARLMNELIPYINTNLIQVNQIEVSDANEN
jgi:hypothetical protein